MSHSPQVLLVEGLVANFLCFLDFEQRWNLRRVCKAWKRAVNCPDCWKNLDLRWTEISLENLFFKNGKLNDRALWISSLQIVAPGSDLEGFMRRLIEDDMWNLKSLEVYSRLQHVYLTFSVSVEVHRLLRKLALENNKEDAYVQYIFSDKRKASKKGSSCINFCNGELSTNATLSCLRRIVIDCPIQTSYIRLLTGSVPNLQDVVMPRIIANHGCVPCCLFAITEFISALPDNQLRVLQIGFTIDMKRTSVLEDSSDHESLAACVAYQNRSIYEEEGDELANLLVNKQRESLVCFWGPDVCVSLQFYLNFKKCKNLQLFRLPGWQALDNFF